LPQQLREKFNRFYNDYEEYITGERLIYPGNFEKKKIYAEKKPYAQICMQSAGCDYLYCNLKECIAIRCKNLMGEDW
jgi:hypothetical protein